MTATHVDTQNASGTTSAIVTKPTGTVDGNLLFAAIQSLSTTSPGAPAGWTLIRESFPNGLAKFSTFYKVASGEGATFTFTGASTTIAIASCFAIASPSLDVESGAINNSSVNECAPSIVITNAHSLLIFAGVHANTSATTPPSGMTEPTNGDLVSTYGVEVAYLLDAAAGATGDKVATITAAGNWAHLAAFKETIALAPPPFRRPNVLLRM